jgi:nucleoside-diphosphate-sugar epimerase
MRVFVAGAAGAIGRRLVPMLVERGHEVVGTTRSAERAGEIETLGARPAVLDALDADAVRDAVAEASPEVVVNQLTALPKRFEIRDLKKYLAPTNRLRVEGTRNLAAAARAAGARRMVSQSIAFDYAPVGDWVKDEDAPLLPGSAGPMGEAADALRALEAATTETEGLEGIVLRYGYFYGPGTYYAYDGSQADDVRRRRFPIVGDGGGVFSFIHIDDAASATVTAIEGEPTGVFNVVDDEPAPIRDWLPAYAEALGAKRPRRVPAFLARLVAGPAVVGMATELRGATNARFKQAFGWQPRYASWREGFREALG